jgi:hypothetical protein
MVTSISRQSQIAAPYPPQGGWGIGMITQAIFEGQEISAEQCHDLPMKIILLRVELSYEN